MNPGRELDALVAEKVFGLPQSIWREGNDYRDKNGVGLVEFGVMPDPYSTDIASAWEIALKMQACFRLEKHFGDGRFEGWWCELSPDLMEGCASAMAKSAPHAICLAALKAVGAID